MMNHEEHVSSHVLAYPDAWLDQYRTHGLVPRWLTDYPDLFRDNLEHGPHPGRLSSRPGTLDLFAQYATQYLLRKYQSVDSITWLNLVANSPSGRTERNWSQMRTSMRGEFEALRSALRAKTWRGLHGEPDLFCWDKEGRWFFAEAKRKDPQTENFQEWVQVYLQTLHSPPNVHVYRLTPRTWSEGRVSTDADHIELRYRSESEDDWWRWPIVARLAPGDKRRFVVEWLVARREEAPGTRVVQAVEAALDYYLVTKREPRPWAYALYHCTTAANLNSHVHWSAPSSSQTTG